MRVVFNGRRNPVIMRYPPTIMTQHKQLTPFLCILVFQILCAAPGGSAFGQGCVAVRGGGGIPIASGNALHQASYLDTGDTIYSFSYRWLHSDRHYVGDVEQPQRQAEHTQVVNDSHFVDLSFTYVLNPRFSLGLIVPMVYSDRSSLYEHDRVHRHSSQAFGIGDIRLAGYGWLFTPAAERRGNALVGLGLKTPTGDYRADDVFQSPTGPVRRMVDQSIQPGDGGWGFTVEAFVYHRLTDGLTAYAQGFYLFNPGDTNGVSTATSFPRRNPYEQIMSIPDQYSARGGLVQDLGHGFSVGLGGRIDGVPVRDLLGDSNGFRRPGFSLFLEPGVYWAKEAWTASLTVPVAVYRNRQRSVADRRLSQDTGEFVHGDAAFADFLVTASLSRTF